MGASPSTLHKPTVQPEEHKETSADTGSDPGAIPHVVKHPCDDYSDNPGSYEDLFRVFKEMTPLCFDGAKLVVNKSLSSHFQINHNLTMGSTPGFKFGATYVGTNQYFQHEIFPVMVGEMSVAGDMNAHLIHQWNQRLRTKLIMQVEKSLLVGAQMTTDYRTARSTTSLTCANIDPLRNQGLFILQYVQKVAKGLTLGTEYFYQYGQQIPSGHIGMVSLAAKFLRNDWSVCASINPTGSVRIGYHHHRQKNPLQFAVEMETNLSTQESVATFCYQLEMAKANCTFKAFADSNWNVGATMEKRLSPMPFALTLSGLLNHVKEAYKFGIGFVIGS